MVDLIFNGHTGREISVALAERPSVPPPQLRGDWIDLGAVDGSMLSSDGTYENIEIECQLNYVCPREKVGDQYRRLKAWIHGAGELSFTDDSQVYYQVKAAGITDFNRRSKIGADVVATFICHPYTFLKAGKFPIKKQFTAYNTLSGDSITIENRYSASRPVYKITGGTSSASANLNVNGNRVSVSKTNGIIIDTGRMLAYNTAGAQNYATNGDFDGLVLEPGKNVISITENDRLLTLEIVPNWRLL